jgi:serine/threonine-protein kinase
VGDPFGIAGTVQARFFRVERAVAEGGFGVVYRAYHEVFRAPVALKCLKVPDSLSEDKRDAFLEKFRGEAELLFRLSAALPEVVRPLQFGVLESAQFVPFMALEWLEGQTLDKMTQGQPLKLSQAIDLLGPVARALSRAHRFSDASASTTLAIIHRDMKPENVFIATIDGERRAKILDFGIARVRADVGAIAGSRTQGDAVNAFSPAYAAPEQWHPESFGANGPWTDVYGFALTVCQALLGAPPIQGDLTAMMGAAINPTWRPTPRTKGVKISDAAEQAFVRALTVDPKQRTQSIEAFWTQLETAVGRPPTLTLRRSAMGLDEEVAKIPSLAPEPLPDLGLEASLPEIPKPASLPNFPPPSAPAPMVPSTPFDDVGPGSFDLDMKRPTPSRPRTRAHEPIGMNLYSPPPVTTASLMDRFRGPAWLVFFAVAIAVGDAVLTRSGTPITLGPVRPLWIAAGLGGLGVLLAILRAVDES